VPILPDFVLLLLLVKWQCANEVNSQLVGLLNLGNGNTLIVSQFKFNSWLSSTRSLQICDENLPSFAVSTLVSFLRGALPQCRTLYTPPFFLTFEPKKTLISVGHPFIYLVGALSGKRGFDTMRVEMTFLWMSEVWTSRWVGLSISTHFTDWHLTYRYRIDKLASCPGKKENLDWLVNEWKKVCSVRKSTLLKR